MMPWASSLQQKRDREVSLARLTGCTPSKWFYLIPGDALVEDSVEYRHSYDQIDLGVEMVTTRGHRWLFAWMMLGELEGLFVGPIDESDYGERSPQSPLSNEWKWDRVEATSRPFLDDTCGMRITGVGVAWQQMTATTMSIWSVRLSSETQQSVVIAAGKHPTSEPGNPPDSVVVVFDESAARQFKAPSSTSSAWGTTISHQPSA